MDPLGTALLLCTIICLILALQWGGVTKAWSHRDVIGTLVGFGVLLVVFIALEIWLDERALLVPRLLRKKTIAFMALFTALSFGVFMTILYYLPIYFQTVSGVSASDSGVRNIPFILAVSLFTVVSGVVISKTQHFLPIIVLGSILATAGLATISTLGVHSPSPQWIGYQVLAGIGLGLNIQVPIIVSQAVVEPSDVSSVTAMIIFFQALSGSIFLSVSQSLFANKLLATVPKYAPGVDPALVVATGATELDILWDGEALAGVIRAYMAGLTDDFYMGIGLAACSAVVALSMVVFDRTSLKGRKVSAGGAA